jgi:hypothetical protein
MKGALACVDGVDGSKAKLRIVDSSVSIAINGQVRASASSRECVRRAGSACIEPGVHDLELRWCRVPSPRYRLWHGSVL